MGSAISILIGTPIYAELVGVVALWVMARRHGALPEKTEGVNRLHLLAAVVRPVTGLAFLVAVVYLAGFAVGSWFVR